jgi:2-oxoisovalerate dehydrogenase E2 component (dihydrolipoyl transacylase)
MGATFVVKLPDIGEGVVEAELVGWHVSVGDIVREDQPLAEVMTDKATVEIPAPCAGTVTALSGEVGAKLLVGSELLRLEAPGASPARPEAATPAEAETTAPAPQPAPPPSGSKPLAAPAVRQRARALGLDLSALRGSGPEGRILHADLDAALRASAPAAPSRDGIEEIPVIGLRRRIAERMAEATRRVAHFSYVEEVDVTALEALRGQLNAGAAERLTLLPFLMLATVRAVADFPQMNAHYDDEAGVIRRHRAVHLGIATQTASGLLVPVLRHAETLGLQEAAAALRRVTEAARDGTARREELTGSTITLTSLGPLGGIAATPVVNVPEVAIIGTNRIATRPAWQDGVGFVPRRMMNLSSSFDHRVIDGHDAASFIQRIRTLLETPALLFIRTTMGQGST